MIFPRRSNQNSSQVSKVAKRGLCMTQTGTPYYASPEAWTRGRLKLWYWKEYIKNIKKQDETNMCDFLFEHG